MTHRLQANRGGQSAPGTLRGKLMGLLRTVPTGRVTTQEAIAVELNAPSPSWVTTTLARLSEDERQLVPWHRVVAAGGAIGRGPWHETQFARLVREGISVSPAGVVQDMGRVAVLDFTTLAVTTGTGTSKTPTKPPSDLDLQAGAPLAAPPPLSRSRGMKVRPGG